MPRPNPARALDRGEAHLAGRIAYEREARGWTYESTASRMTAAGCPIQSSAIYKIEKGEPRRRITVDELIGFASIFNIGVEKLLQPIQERDDLARRIEEVLTAEAEELKYAVNRLSYLGRLLRMLQDGSDVADVSALFMQFTASDIEPRGDEEFEADVAENINRVSEPFHELLNRVREVN